MIKIIPPTEELLKAIKEQDIGMAMIYLEQGADPNVRDSGSTNDTALHYAVNDKSGELVKLLIKKGADLNTPNSNGLTPLMYAVCWNNIHALSFLIKKGALLDKKDRWNRTALNITAEIGDREKAAEMIKNAFALQKQQVEERKRIETFRNTASKRQATLNKPRKKVKIVRPS